MPTSNYSFFIMHEGDPISAASSLTQHRNAKNFLISNEKALCSGSDANLKSSSIIPPKCKTSLEESPPRFFSALLGLICTVLFNCTASQSMRACSLMQLESSNVFPIIKKDQFLMYSSAKCITEPLQTIPKCSPINPHSNSSSARCLRASTLSPVAISIIFDFVITPSL